MPFVPYPETDAWRPFDWGFLLSGCNSRVELHRLYSEYRGETA